METKEVVIVSYARTAFTRAKKGLFKDTRPDTLAAHVIKAALEQAPGVKGEDIEDVVLGCAMPEGEQGNNVARVAAVLAGLPDSVPGMTVNRFCSSGVQTIAQVAERIMVGANDIAIAGGTESMTMIPMGGNKFSASPIVMEEYPEVYTPMGTTAENVAKKFEVSRETQDAFALTSHEKALNGWATGFLAGEVVPMETEVINEQGQITKVTVSQDDGPRPGSTLEKLAKLRPVFNPKGSVTAANASPLTDGAAAVVMMSKEKADELGLESMGTYVGFQVAGVPPEIMGIGPVPAIRKLLAKHNLTIDDIDLFEINEAFAAQATYCGKELGVPAEKLNIHGGAIALGHPLGVSGTRMTGTLLRSLAHTGGRYGIVSMCIGGGMGAAALFEYKGEKKDMTKKAASSTPSYYIQIDGQKYDRGVIEAAKAAVAGAGDGRISQTDAETILAEVKDGDRYTDIEKNTVKYVRENFKWTDAADEWFRTEVRRWAGERGAKK